MPWAGFRSGGRRNPETEQRELELFIVNDGDLYRQRVQPIIANLAKKTRKGVYDHAKAAKLWGYLADAGAQKYTKDFDARGSTSFGIFSKADRTAVAKSLADYYLDDVKEAAGTKSNPRRRRRHSSHRRTKMARRKKYRRTARRVKGYRGGVRVVRFKVRGRVKIVRFHKPGTKGFRSGVAKKRATGKRLARKWGFFRKGSAIYQKRPGKKSKLIRRL